jgi:tRNA pseudouridine38-40 synthase
VHGTGVGFQQSSLVQTMNANNYSANESVMLRGVVRYDGTNFAGWQVQPHARTVQGELQRVLTLIARKPVKVRGASRTDSGVHALGQVIAFPWRPDDSPERLRHSLSMLLAPEIRVESLAVTRPEFHPRFDATAKRYAYALCLQKESDPFAARYAWLFRWDFDPELLRTLTQRLVGRRDFAGFQSSSAAVRNTVRTIHSIELQPGAIIGVCDHPNLVRLEFHGDGFLYKMIRNIVGTVMHVARGKLPVETLDQRLDSPGPYLGYTAPACGLTLREVEFKQKERREGISQRSCGAE